MLRLFMFAFVFLLANSSSAQDVDYLQGTVIQGPFKTDIVNGGELSFLQTTSEEFPVSLVLDVVGVDNKKNRSLVDKYDVAGSDPKIESIYQTEMIFLQNDSFLRINSCFHLIAFCCMFWYTSFIEFT